MKLNLESYEKLWLFSEHLSELLSPMTIACQISWTVVQRYPTTFHFGRCHVILVREMHKKMYKKE